MSDLVTRLCAGEHPVEVMLRSQKTVEALQACLNRGYVLVKFTATHGGTELGMNVDHSLTDVSRADFAGATGRLRIVGDLVLDYVPVRCVADVELPSFSGTGHLELRSN